MTFKLEINCDNAAFEDCGRELNRILSDVAKIVDHDVLEGLKAHLYDSNGNRVGHFQFKGKRPE